MADTLPSLPIARALGLRDGGVGGAGSQKATTWGFLVVLAFVMPRVHSPDSVSLVESVGTCDVTWFLIL